MMEERWTEPTQQKDSATKAILTAADDRAEKDTAGQRHKDASFGIYNRAFNTLSGFQRSKSLLTVLKSIHFVFIAAITSLSAIL